jgi:hypothetical protein
MTDSYALIFQHVVLPDSLSERKKVLLAFRRVLRPRHPCARNIERQLDAIANLDSLQTELPLQFVTRADVNH